jgi:26S proteasome regulatory subunit T5
LADRNQLLDIDDEGEEDGAVKNETNVKKGKCAVIKTSSRQVSLATLMKDL